MIRLAKYTAAVAAFGWWTWLVYANGVDDGARQQQAADSNWYRPEGT